MRQDRRFVSAAAVFTAIAVAIVAIAVSCFSSGGLGAYWAFLAFGAGRSDSSSDSSVTYFSVAAAARMRDNNFLYRCSVGWDLFLAALGLTFAL